MVRQAIFALFAFILPYVMADGYPKGTPDIPFNTGSAGGSLPDNGNSGYPSVSMDYDSRYRGPVATLNVLPDGHIADTAEVTAARAAHLAALDKAKVLWTQTGAQGGQGVVGHGGSSTGGDDGYSYPQPGSNSLEIGSNGGQSYLPPQGVSGGSIGHGQGGSPAALVGNMPYNGPLAMLMVLQDGHIADTAEVTAARAAHLAALDKAKALSSQTGALEVQGGMGHGGSPGSSAGGNGGYSYPQPGSNSLEARSNSDMSYPPPHVGNGGSGSQGQAGSSVGTPGNMPYNGPLAMLMVLPSGYLADTADIAALRAAHLSALLKAQSAWKPQDGSEH